MLTLSYLVLLVLGFLVGTAGSFIQAAWFPGGLLLALAASTGLAFGGRMVTQSRLGGVLPSAAWLVTVLLLMTGRSEGDFVFANGIGPYAFLLIGTMVGVMSGTMPMQSER